MPGLPGAHDLEEPFGPELPPRRIGQPSAGGLPARRTGYLTREVAIDGDGKPSNRHTGILRSAAFGRQNTLTRTGLHLRPSCLYLVRRLVPTPCHEPCGTAWVRTASISVHP